MSAPQLGPASRALRAVSAVLDAAARGDGEGAVHRALVSRARELFEPPAAALLALDGAGRLRVLAAEPDPGGAEDRLAPAGGLPFLSEAVEAGPRAMAVSGEQAAAFAQLGLSGDPPGALLALPLGRWRESALALVLAAAPGEGFGAAELELGEAFAAAAGASLEQLQLAEQNARRTRQQAALANAARALNERLEVREALGRIAREAAGIIGADHATVYRLAAGEALELAAGVNLPPEAVGLRLGPGEGLAGRVAAGGEPATRAAGGEDPPAPSLPRSEAALAVPIRWGGTLRGVLEVGFAGAGEARPDDLTVLEAFAELAGVACANASAEAGLAATARTDGLTGCLNHAALHEAVRREIDRCRRTGGRFSVVLLDLDDFQLINERHGHLAGDEVLRRAGRALRQGVRTHDLVARYGGDEFSILAVDAEEPDATTIAERAIAWLTSMAGEHGGDAPRARATAGVAEWAPAQSPAELLDEAERALVFGKQHGERGGVTPASSVPEGFRLRRFRRAEPAEPAASGRESDVAAAARQTDRLRRRSRQLALANALGARLAAMTDVEAILDAAVGELHEEFGYFLCAVLELRQDGTLCGVAGRGRPFDRLGPREWSQPAAAGLLGRCLRERRAVVSGDVRSEPDYLAGEETAEVRSELCVPLWAGDRLWGAIDVEDLEPDAFDEDDVRLVRTVADQTGSALRSATLYERLDRAYLGTAEALAAALEAKDSYTASHAHSIVSWAEAVGERLGMEEDELRAVRFGAALHDIGKIAVPETILNKRGPLTRDERREIERHTVVGEQILAPIDFLADVRPLVRHEHERFDGQGYPDGLAGQDIPLGARVILACDAFHAMTSDRPYRAAMTAAEAAEELRLHAGTQFDPRVVDALLATLRDEQRL